MVANDWRVGEVGSRWLKGTNPQLQDEYVLRI